MAKNKKEYCMVCGVKLPSNPITEAIYPPFEFKEGKACFGCGKRKQKKQQRNIGK